MEGDFQQRLSLLQGLFDTDGTWNPLRKQAIFSTSSRPFAMQISTLLASLGQKPYCVELKKHGFGKDVIAYDVIITPRGINPFKAYPKASDVDTRLQSGDKSSKRYIKSIVEVESVPTQCIAVDSDDNTYCCTDRFVVTHNTGGKIRVDEDQLILNAAALSVVRPKVKVFQGSFIWTAHQEITPIRPVTKDEIPTIWAEYMAKVKRIEEAWKYKNFPARKSGLCPYCGVTSCEYWRPLR